MGSCLQKASPLLREYRPPTRGALSHPNIPPSLLKFRARPHLSTPDLRTAAPHLGHRTLRQSRPVTESPLGLQSRSMDGGLAAGVTGTNNSSEHLGGVRKGPEEKAEHLPAPHSFSRCKNSAGDKGSYSAHLGLFVSSENPAPRTVPSAPVTAQVSSVL